MANRPIWGCDQSVSKLIPNRTLGPNADLMTARRTTGNACIGCSIDHARRAPGGLIAQWRPRGRRDKRCMVRARLRHVICAIFRGPAGRDGRNLQSATDMDHLRHCFAPYRMRPFGTRMK